MIMINKIFLILVLLVLVDLGNTQDLSENLKSTVIITDSLIINEIQPSKMMFFAPLGSIPLGLLNSAAIIISPTNIIKTIPAGLVGLGTTIIHPVFVGMSLYNIQKKKAKKRLLLKYSDKYNIIDKSSINCEHIPYYSIYVGLNYSTFLTNNISTKPNISFGLKYTRPFLKYFSFSTKINISNQNIEIHDKKYEFCDMMVEPQKHIVDINYKSLDIFCPIYLSINLPLKDNHKIFCSVGTGIPISLGSSSYEIIKRDVDFKNSDYGMKETWPYEWSNPMYSINFGYSNRNWFSEIEIIQDYNYEKLGRSVPRKKYTNIYVDNKLMIIQFVVGYHIK